MIKRGEAAPAVRPGPAAPFRLTALVSAGHTTGPVRRAGAVAEPLGDDVHRLAGHRPRARHQQGPRLPDRQCRRPPLRGGNQRKLIATRLRQKWDELQRIVDRPPEQHSAIGKVVVGSDGRPVINATAVIGAIREQLKIETQYRAMFGVDLATRPPPSSTKTLSSSWLRSGWRNASSPPRPLPSPCQRSPGTTAA